MAQTTDPQPVPDFYEAGRAAFAAGRPSAPILDATVWSAIQDLPVGGGAAPIFRAFSDGWRDANLAAPVPES